jgi:hypothetical protein
MTKEGAKEESLDLYSGDTHLLDILRFSKFF